MYRLCIIAIGALVLSGFYIHGLPAERRDDLDLSDYEPTFIDTFQKLDVSARGPDTRWTAHTPWNGDFGDAAFADPDKDFPFTSGEGGLRIEARKNADGKWSSGLIASSNPTGGGFWQQYGYFEMQAKLPPGPGLWPGFWLIGNSLHDNSAELDILEYLGHDPSKYEATVHVWPKNGAGRNYEARFAVRVPAGSLTTAYHRYGASIDPDWIVFYLDRHEVGRTPTPPEFRQKVFILADLAMGSGWPIDKTPNPSRMDIAYIEAWQRKGAAVAPKQK